MEERDSQSLAQDGRVAESLTAGGVLHTDFCPWANKYVYWLKSPLGVLIAFCGACLLAGWGVAPEAFALAGASGLLIGLGVAWPAIAISGLHASLHFSKERGNEGEELSVLLDITNMAPWPVWGIQLEHGFFIEGDQVAAALSCVRGCSKMTYRWQFTPPLRGCYPLEAPRIAVGFPFGLWQARKQVACDRKLLVWPRRLSLQQFPLPAGNQTALYMASDEVVGHEGERVGLRPYRPGDSLRNVHWGQTARFDRLIVCERQGAAQSDVEIVPVLESLSTQGGKDAPAEWGLRLLASIASAFHHQGVVVNVAWGNDVITVGPDASSFVKLMDALARWAPSDAMSTLPVTGPNSLNGLSSRKSPRSRKGPRFVIEAEDSAASEKQTQALKTLRVRYFPGRARGKANGFEKIVLGSPAHYAEEFASGWVQASREVWHAH